MPKDQRTSPVENFRLTKEQLGFQKRFRTLKEIQEMLQLRTLNVQQEMQTIQEMWQTLEGEFQMLQPPSEPVRELQGMNFAQEPEEQTPLAPERYQLKY